MDALVGEPGDEKEQGLRRGDSLGDVSREPRQSDHSGRMQQAVESPEVSGKGAW